jgi:hypothetical protein
MSISVAENVSSECVGLGDLTVCYSCSATTEQFSRFAQGRPLRVLHSERG